MLAILIGIDIVQFHFKSCEPGCLLKEIFWLVSFCCFELGCLPRTLACAMSKVFNFD